MPIQGSVKWFDPKKGYGFLVGPDGQDVFVHFSQILGEGFRTLADGQSVGYDLVHGTKGFQAQNVLATPQEHSGNAPVASALDPASATRDPESEAQRQHAQAAAAEQHGDVRP